MHTIQLENSFSQLSVQCSFQKSLCHGLDLPDEDITSSDSLQPWAIFLTGGVQSPEEAKKKKKKKKKRAPLFIFTADKSKITFLAASVQEYTTEESIHKQTVQHAHTYTQCNIDDVCVFLCVYMYAHQWSLQSFTIMKLLVSPFVPFQLFMSASEIS